MCFICLVITRVNWFMGVTTTEDNIVDNGSKGGTNEGAHPVDPMVTPVTANKGRAE